MATVLRWWFVLFGVVCVGIAVAHLFFGSSTIIGGGSVNATIDSDMRFYAVLFVAFGGAYVWAAQDVVGRARAANLLGLIFFVGGLARLLAWWQTGQPNWFYVLMIPLELLVPVVNWWLLGIATRQAGPVSRQAAATRSGSASI